MTTLLDRVHWASTVSYTQCLACNEKFPDISKDKPREKNIYIMDPDTTAIRHRFQNNCDSYAQEIKRQNGDLANNSNS